MSFRLSFAAVALLIAPALVQAQRGGGGGRSMNVAGASGPTDAQLGAVNTRNVDKLNPLTILIDKKKDLKLPDSTVKAFKILEAAIKDSVKPTYKAIDSLNKELRPRDAQHVTDDDRARVTNARHELDKAVAAVRGRYDTAQAKAFTYLTADQQTKATSFLEDVRSDVAQSEEQARNPARSGGRGGRPGGGSGGMYGSDNEGGSSVMRGGGTSLLTGTGLGITTHRQLEQLNPIEIIVQNKETLALQDSTLARLDSLNRLVTTALSKPYASFDSLTRVIQSRGGPGDPSAEQSVRDLNDIATRIKATYDVVQGGAFNLLTPTDQAAAAVIIERAKGNTQHSSATGRGGAGGGGGGRGGVQ